MNSGFPVDYPRPESQILELASLPVFLVCILAAILHFQHLEKWGKQHVTAENTTSTKYILTFT